MFSPFFASRKAEFVFYLALVVPAGLQLIFNYVYKKVKKDKSVSVWETIFSMQVLMPLLILFALTMFVYSLCYEELNETTLFAYIVSGIGLVVVLLFQIFWKPIKAFFEKHRVEYKENKES